jgi:glutaredoxin 3
MPTQPKVELYVTDYCPYCTRAKALLDRREVHYELIDVTHDPARRAWLVEATGRRTVPQIFIGGKPIGGSDELHALDRTGELAKLLGRA